MNSHIISILPPAFDHEIKSFELTDQNNWSGNSDEMRFIGNVREMGVRIFFQQSPDE